MDQIYLVLGLIVLLGLAILSGAAFLALFMPDENDEHESPEDRHG